MSENHEPPFRPPLTLTEGDRDLLIAARAQARAEQRAEADRQEGARLARRIMIAGLLIIGIAVGCLIALPAMGLDLSLMVPVVAFVAIASGAWLTGRAEGVVPDADAGSRHNCDDGKCLSCAGPQPLRLHDPKPPTPPN